MAVGLCEAEERLWKEKGSAGRSKHWASVIYKKQKAARTDCEEAQRAGQSGFRLLGTG